MFYTILDIRTGILNKSKTSLYIYITYVFIIDPIVFTSVIKKKLENQMTLYSLF